MIMYHSGIIKSPIVFSSVSDHSCTHTMQENSSDMAYMHPQRGVGHNQCYKPTKIDTVTRVSDSMEIVTVRLKKTYCMQQCFR